MYKNTIKLIILFIIGGFLYCGVELLWRGYTHWSMLGIGGLAFIACGVINEHLKWETPLYQQCAIATFITLIIEFLSGCIINLWLGLNVWDYSDLPYSLLGQINLFYAIGWYFLVSIAIILDDLLRYIIWEEPLYKYKII